MTSSIILFVLNERVILLSEHIVPIGKSLIWAEILDEIFDHDGTLSLIPTNHVPKSNSNQFNQPHMNQSGNLSYSLVHNLGYNVPSKINNQITPVPIPAIKHWSLLIDSPSAMQRWLISEYADFSYLSVRLRRTFHTAVWHSANRGVPTSNKWGKVRRASISLYYLHFT